MDLDNMFLEIHGSLVLHPWIRTYRESLDDGDGLDAWALLTSRLDLLQIQSSGSGLWRTNEAGECWGHGDSAACRLAWFQVQVGTTESAHALPLHLLAICAHDVIDRVGTHVLHGFRALLPLTQAPFPAVSSSLFWFELAAPFDRVQCTATLVGPRGKLLSRREIIFERAQARYAGQFAISSIEEAATDVIQDEPVYLSAWRPGPLEYLALRIGVPEWTSDTAAWAMAFLAQCCHDAGYRGHLSISISQVEPDGNTRSSW